MKKLIAGLSFLFMVVLSFSSFNSSVYAAVYNDPSGITEGVTYTGKAGLIFDNNLSTYALIATNEGALSGWVSRYLASNQASVWYMSDKDLYIRGDTFGGAAVFRNAPILLPAAPSGNIVTLPINNGNCYLLYIYAVTGTVTLYEMEFFSTPDGPIIPPSPPTGLTVTSGNKQLTLSWDTPTNPDDAYSYTIYRDGSYYWTLDFVANGPETVTSYVDTGMGDGVTHSYALSRTNKQNATSDLTAAVSGSTWPVPVNPVLSHSGVTFDTVKLQWTSMAANYEIYRNGSLVTTLPGTEFFFTDLAPETSYSFYVIGTDAYGRRNQSNTINLTTTKRPPTAPGSLTFTDHTYDSFSATWGASQATDNYDVYLDGELLGNTIENTYSFNGLTADKLYTVKVVAKGPGGSAETTGMHKTLTLPKPEIPVLTLSGLTHDAFTVNWLPTLNTDSYDVYLDGVMKGNTTENTFSMTGLTPEKIYVVKIVAKNSFGNTAEKSISTKTLKAPVPTVHNASVKPITGQPNKRTLTYEATDVSAVKIYMNGTLVGTYLSSQREIELDYSGITQMFTDIKVEPVEVDGKAYEFKALSSTTGSQDIDDIISAMLGINQVIKNGFREIAIGSVVILILVVLFFWYRNKFKGTIKGDKLPKKLVKASLPGDTKPDRFPRMKKNRDGFTIVEQKYRDTGGLFRSKIEPDFTYEKNGIKYKRKRIKGRGMVYEPANMQEKVKHVKHRINAIKTVFTPGNRPAPVNNNIQRSSTYTPTKNYHEKQKQQQQKSHYGNTRTQKSGSNKPKFR